MFGYVRLHKPEIKMGEYEQYRGIYCTLCRRLGKRYGLPARLAISYDMTFLALLYMALEPNEPQFCPGRCSFNPTKKCPRCQHTDGIDLAADVSVLLNYYKLQDTLRDERLPKRLVAYCLLPFASSYRRKAARRHREIDEWAAAMMKAQIKTEQANTQKIDLAAEPFAGFLGQLAEAIAFEEKQRPILQRLGYCLGRWIYLLDAAEDLPQDIRCKRYNPFAVVNPPSAEDKNAIKQLRQQTLPMLNACLAECLSAYYLLEVRRFDGILRNILSEGLPHAQQRVLSGEEPHHE